MREFGSFCLSGGLLLSAYALVAGGWGAIRRDARIIGSANNALLASSLLACLSLLSLACGFVTHDYQNLYVWQHSNNAMHPAYLVSAVWGGMDGSLLLWAAIAGVYTLTVLGRKCDIPQNIYSWLVPILASVQGFFLAVVTILTNPFRTVPPGAHPLDVNMGAQSTVCATVIFAKLTQLQLITTDGKALPACQSELFLFTIGRGCRNRDCHNCRTKVGKHAAVAVRLPREEMNGANDSRLLCHDLPHANACMQLDSNCDDY